jgi:hypothetical protein
MELRAAGRDPDGTAAFAQALESGEVPTFGPDGKPLSRRDRRRLERTAKPMETWTAEEEQIATGQIPAMTPEVIAEHEKLAKEKARLAAEEAEAASAELRRVAFAGSYDGTDGDEAPRDADEPPEMPTAPATPTVTERPRRASIFGGGAPEPSGAPVADEPVPGPEAALEAADLENAVVAEEEPPGFEFAVAPEIGWPSESGDDGDGADVSAWADPATAPAPAAPAPDEPSWMADVFQAANPDQHIDEPAPVVHESAAWTQEQPAPTADEMSPWAAEPSPAAPGDPEQEAQSLTPENFRNIFPPGSLQARMMQEGAAAAYEAAERAGFPTGQIPVVTEQGSVAEADAPLREDVTSEGPAEQVDPAEEIRRLTAQAMSGIEHPPSAHDDAPDVPRPASPYDTDTPVSADEPAPTPVPFAGFGLGADAPSTQDNQPPFGAVAPATDPSVEAPATFDEIFDANAGAGAEEDQPVNAAQPDGAQPDVAQPGPAEAAPEASAQDYNEVDRPSYDQHREGPFSQELPVQEPAHELEVPPGSFSPASNEFPVVEPVTTGNIEVARRQTPELEPAGGARHFRWAHLAVIASIAFLLGVVVWNLAGPGS